MDTTLSLDFCMGSQTRESETIPRKMIEKLKSLRQWLGSDDGA